MCRVASNGCRVIDVGHSRVVEMRNGKRGIHEKAKNVDGGDRGRESVMLVN